VLTMVSTKRKLSADERTVEPADASAALFPAVVEPTADDASLATELGGALGARVLLHLELYGAVLLRGWRVHTADDLAIAVAALSAHGLTCLSDYFPAESGRDERLHAFGATYAFRPSSNCPTPANELSARGCLPTASGRRIPSSRRETTWYPRSCRTRRITVRLRSPTHLPEPSLTDGCQRRLVCVCVTHAADALEAPRVIGARSATELAPIARAPFRRAHMMRPTSLRSLQLRARAVARW
jgi:hypothetical protein